MSYSIIRMQKMKSNGIKGIQFHNQRERESETNPDINKADSHLNYDLINGQRQIDYNEKISQVIEDNVTSGKKIRKDAVKLAEFLITSDKEFFDKISPKEQKRYFETAHEFLADRYGEKNLIYATVHYDEKTPHMHVGFVPVTEDGRLSAKDFFGQKKQLVSLQDDFNKYLKQNDFDLERGVSSSRKHVETAKYKAQTFQSMEKEAKRSTNGQWVISKRLTTNRNRLRISKLKRFLGLLE
ncbi:MobV family relaxase [Klebsiella pneumoniae]|uniref:MobV family relaxase n=1 Tax=Klebsiella pneumoniae TaxID=573 RepID=UPI000E2FE82B